MTTAWTATDDAAVSSMMDAIGRSSIDEEAAVRAKVLGQFFESKVEESDREHEVMYQAAKALLDYMSEFPERGDLVLFAAASVCKRCPVTPEFAADVVKKMAPAAVRAFKTRVAATREGVSDMAETMEVVFDFILKHESFLSYRQALLAHQEAIGKAAGLTQNPSSDQGDISPCSDGENQKEAQNEAQRGPDVAQKGALPSGEKAGDDLAVVLDEGHFHGLLRTNVLENCDNLRDLLDAAEGDIDSAILAGVKNFVRHRFKKWLKKQRELPLEEDAAKKNARKKDDTDLKALLDEAHFHSTLRTNIMDNCENLRDLLDATDDDIDAAILSGVKDFVKHRFKKWLKRQHDEALHQDGITLLEDPQRRGIGLVEEAPLVVADNANKKQQKKRSRSLPSEEEDGGSESSSKKRLKEDYVL